MRQLFSKGMSLVLVLAMLIPLCAMPAMAAGEAEGTATAAMEGESLPVNTLMPEATAPPEPVEVPGSEVSEAGPVVVLEDELIQSANADAANTAEGEGSGDTEGSEELSVTVTYYGSDRTTVLGTETIAPGAALQAVPAADGAVWTDSEGRLADTAALRPAADTALYAWYKPSLNISETEHTRYINGTGSGTFSPTAALTRGQAAVILHQLLGSPTAMGPYNSTFTDLKDDAYYTTPVKVLASYNILSGYAQSDGTFTFRPGRNVTRAEFVTMIVNLYGGAAAGASTGKFTDVSAGNWAMPAIATAASNGWISGFEEKDHSFTFRPQNSITRAQAVVVTNNMLGRKADMTTISQRDDILHFLDVPENKSTEWYYPAILEASTGHTCRKSTGGESWTSYNKESTGMATGIHKVGSIYCYINALGQPARLQSGINKTAGGQYLYAPGDGYTASIDLSTKPGYALMANSQAALKEGPTHVGSYYFYWNASKNEPVYFAAGLNAMNGQGYWADGAGYAIRHDFTRGPVALNDRRYLATNGYTIALTGLAHPTNGSKVTTVDLRNKTYEFDNSMYYVKDDYSLACDSWQGLLYFGKDCKYTSGDAQLDAYVWQVVSSIAGSTSLTQTQKLLTAYYKIRGGWGDKFDSDSMFSYGTNSLIFDPGRYDWHQHIDDFIKCAKQMFSSRRGMCYGWALAYCYVARRLGFQAYVVVGKLWKGYQNPHCWSMIQWDGVWHISDVEIEWGHLCGYYPGGKYYRNLFDIVADPNASHVKHPECQIDYYFP